MRPEIAYQVTKLQIEERQHEAAAARRARATGTTRDALSAGARLLRWTTMRRVAAPTRAA